MSLIQHSKIGFSQLQRKTKFIAIGIFKKHNYVLGGLAYDNFACGLNLFNISYVLSLSGKRRKIRAFQILFIFIIISWYHLLINCRVSFAFKNTVNFYDYFTVPLTYKMSFHFPFPMHCTCLVDGTTFFEDVSLAMQIPQLRLRMVSSFDRVCVLFYIDKKSIT